MILKDHLYLHNKTSSDVVISLPALRRDVASPTMRSGKSVATEVIVKRGELLDLRARYNLSYLQAHAALSDCALGRLEIVDGNVKRLEAASAAPMPAFEPVMLHTFPSTSVASREAAKRAGLWSDPDDRFGERVIEKKHENRERAEQIQAQEALVKPEGAPSIQWPRDKLLDFCKIHEIAVKDGLTKAGMIRLIRAKGL